MAYIATVRPSVATAETATVYEYMRRVGGIDRVTGIVQVFRDDSFDSNHLLDLVLWHNHPGGSLTC